MALKFDISSFEFYNVSDKSRGIPILKKFGIANPGKRGTYMKKS